jgi:hypothetical protein
LEFSWEFLIFVLNIKTITKMKKFIKDPLKVFVSSIFFLAFAIVLITQLTSCVSEIEKAQKEKQAVEVVNDNTKDIIIETLHGRQLRNGVHKLTIDSSQYIVVVDFDAMAITKHK